MEAEVKADKKPTYYAENLKDCPDHKLYAKTYAAEYYKEKAPEILAQQKLYRIRNPEVIAYHSKTYRLREKLKRLPQQIIDTEKKLEEHLASKPKKKED